ncbi:hypothetical protein V6N13_049752 [Hibiscus sabdariffa]|uniref:Uncharacterized protein n=1 Tax=Hibiscus sabdariffa TaxID=183260 RepID=A0ABR2QWN3_9ROSI
MPENDPDPDPDSETLQPDTAIDLDDEDDIFDDDDEEEEEENDDVSFEPARLTLDEAENGYTSATYVNRTSSGPRPRRDHQREHEYQRRHNRSRGIGGFEESHHDAGPVASIGRREFGLKSLGLFDSVTITLDSGPPEIPGSANVIIEIVSRSKMKE